MSGIDKQDIYEQSREKAKAAKLLNSAIVTIIHTVYYFKPGHKIYTEKYPYAKIIEINNDHLICITPNNKKFKHFFNDPSIWIVFDSPYEQNYLNQ